MINLHVNVRYIYILPSARVKDDGARFGTDKHSDSVSRVRIDAEDATKLAVRPENAVVDPVVRNAARLHHSMRRHALCRTKNHVHDMYTCTSTCTCT